MKNFTLISLIAAMFVFSAAHSQDCSDLMISEVVEGWSNNKAIEIYNPTAVAIDASEYGVVRFQNGSTEYGEITYLVDVVIEPYDVYVMVLDKRDPDGIDFEYPVWDELQAVADGFYNPNYENGVHPMYFNGNDALALVKDGGQALVDVFGKIGDSLNPDGWGGYIDSEGEQAYISQDHTLVRKATVVQGYTTNPSSFDILNEYDSLSANTFTELGFHICECDMNSVEEVEQTTVKLFPNPSTDGKVVVTALQSISKIQVYNMIGILVEEVILENESSTYLDLSLLDSGSYIINVSLENGEETSQVFIK